MTSSVSTFRRQLIEQVVAETGVAICHYCKIECRLSFSNKYKNSATVDHKIPRSKGGTNDRENLVLACNDCNNLKGDRSYEDFIRDPNPRNRFVLPYVAPLTAAARASAAFNKKEKETVHPAYKVTKGTLAAALQSGEVQYHRMYVKTPAKQLQPEPRNRIKAVPYHKTMYILTGKRHANMADYFDKR